MKTYNGYASAERTKVGNYQNKLIKSGELINPDQCDICNVSHQKTSKKIQRHNENYSNPLDFYPICIRCHLRLHRRFDNWKNWKEIIVPNHINDQSTETEKDLTLYGKKWFHKLKRLEEPNKRFEYEQKKLL